MMIPSVFASSAAAKVAKASGFCRSAARPAKSRRLSLPSRGLFLTLMVLCSIALTGCQTAHQFATPDRTWKTHIGQLKYSDTKRTVIGDVVVQRRGEQEFQLEFQKAGGIPLLTLREDATTARAEGLFARGSWQGTPADAPKHLRSWLALREAFLLPAHGGTWKNPNASAEGQLAWKTEVTSGSGALQAVSCGFPTGEQRFDFQFNR